MTDKPLVVDVGQCDPDHGSIRRLVEGMGARVVRAHVTSDALDYLEREQPALVLVNRVFDADGGDGVSLVKTIASRGIPVMLVSNYPEYQVEAVKAGALEGFGKAELSNPETRERLEQALGSRKTGVTSR